MALCTQADIEKLLQIDFGADPDAVVAQAIAQATAIVTNYCGQSLEWEAGIVETHETKQPTAWLQLDRYPVTAVASVVEDGATLAVTDEYVWYEEGQLRRVAGQYDWEWSTFVNGIVVTYSAGYVTIPDDVILVAASLASGIFKSGAAFAAHGVSAGPVQSLTLDGSDSVTYFQAPSDLSDGGAQRLGEAHKALLAPYVRRSL